ncbi:GGDEF domain-containing protein [Xanthobacter agilis]|uniref:diguanylate cyclase n=1 Tax=Xanthobacter agilis TaxID=47492 RepID=A0ABU0LC41_XANAG|nr:GGDEF domain-containing protein [Xanthobacter agilis]MDQ0504714.1 diguanylate cyclase (GGDEF)-like protein [Xanthobacter agilis]
MTLHVPTILLTSAMMNALIAALQLFISHRLQNVALAYWALCNVAVATGATLLGLRAEIPLVVSVVLGNGLLLFGLGLVLSGVRSFDGKTPRLGLVAAIAALGMGLLFLSLHFGDNLGQRIILISLLIAGWCLLAAIALHRGPERDHWSFARSVCSVLISAMGGLYAARALAVATGWLSTENAYAGTPQAVLVLSGLAIGIGWNFCSLYMVLDRFASTDELTGLLNRRTTLLRGRHLFDDAIARRSAMSILMVDLDHFKSINDRFGHHVGDAVLHRFADVAPRGLRFGDVIGRLGGEEFCVLLPGADSDTAWKLGERLRLIAELELRVVASRPVHATVTIGIATLPADPPAGPSLASLIRAADEALYLGKAEGRNRVLVAGRPPARDPDAVEADMRGICA